MITLIVLVISLGFFLLYNTSEKAVLGRFSLLEKWAQDHPRPGKYGGLLLCAIAMAASITYFGTGAGIFSFFVILMTVASLVILLAPLRYIHHKALIILFSLSLTIEVILSYAR